MKAPGVGQKEYGRKSITEVDCVGASGDSDNVGYSADLSGWHDIN